MRRESMGLGPDALTIYCKAGHSRLDLAIVDVSGESETWRGFVLKGAVEGGDEYPGLTFLRQPSAYALWSGQIRTAVAGKPLKVKTTTLRIECPRCAGRWSSGTTVRVKGHILQAIVGEGIRQASPGLIEGFSRNVP